jgi:hypothetical protein
MTSKGTGVLVPDAVVVSAAELDVVVGADLQTVRRIGIRRIF